MFTYPLAVAGCRSLPEEPVPEPGSTSSSSLDDVVLPLAVPVDAPDTSPDLQFRIGSYPPHRWGLPLYKKWGKMDENAGKIH